MSEQTNPRELTAFERFSEWRRNSLALKLATVGILILLMLIPLGMIESLIRERSWRKEEAVQEVASTWGGRQEICGPVLTVPYVVYITQTNYPANSGVPVTSRTKEIRYAHFLPELLDIQSEVDPMTRKRGIYEVLVYTADVELSGRFSNPDFSGWLGAEEILWDKAYLALGISDLRSIRDEIIIEWDGDPVKASSGVSNVAVIQSGVTAPVSVNHDPGAVLEFKTHIRLGGNSSLRFVPVGETTTASMKSIWDSPKFEGSFLPDPKPEVTKDGFYATWKVLHLNRNYPQRFTGYVDGIYESAFGAELLIMVDHYQLNERSAKYGVMLITLVFLMFFFTQALNRIRIHFVQYLLVGFALSLFYLLLLSFSEHIGFVWAYLIGSAATILLVTTYFLAVTSSNRLSMMLLFLLSFIFAFIFVIIRMEDFALLVGSIGLFAALSVVMYLSRKVNWYTLGKKID